MPESLDLSPDQCEELLSAGVIGRVAFPTPTGPQIFPVNYSVVSRAIVIRTSAYGALGVYGRGAQVAFEIDQFDHEYQHGWSVVAHGHLSHVTEHDEIERIRAVWEPRPWADGASRNLYLRLPWTSLTGRKLGAGWDVFGTLVTRRMVPAARIDSRQAAL